MTRVDILPLQAEKEREAIAGVAAVDAKVRADAKDAVEIEIMTEFGMTNAASLLKDWSALADRLVAKYSDGYINPPPNVQGGAIAIGYPATWLSVTDYANGPVSYAMKG